MKIAFISLRLAAECEQPTEYVLGLLHRFSREVVLCGNRDEPILDLKHPHLIHMGCPPARQDVTIKLMLVEVLRGP